MHFCSGKTDPFGENMINEKRVRHMTHMAMYEQIEAENYQSMLNMSRRDYVKLHTIIGLLAGTVLYGLAAALVVVILFSTLLTNLSIVLLILFTVLFLLGYVLFLYFFLNRIRLRAYSRYNEEKKKIRLVMHDWDILKQLYEEEDESRTPQQQNASDPFDI